MKITLLTVGKTDKDWVRQGMEIYTSRLKHYITFGIVEIPELKNVSALSREQIKSREGELILKNIRPADDLILLATISNEIYNGYQALERYFEEISKFYSPVI